MNLGILTSAFLALSLPIGTLSAQTVVPNRTIRGKSIITASAITLLTESVSGAFQSPEQVIGKEARTILYPGQPIRQGDVGPPAIVERNQLVTLVFSSVNLFITGEGRALGRGGLGDRIQVMNLDSRAKISGIIINPGTVSVGK